MTNNLRRKDEETDENMTKMMTLVGLLAKHMIGSGFKSVNSIWVHGIKSMEKEIAYYNTSKVPISDQTRRSIEKSEVSNLW